MSTVQCSKCYFEQMLIRTQKRIDEEEIPSLQKPIRALLAQLEAELSLHKQCACQVEQNA